MSQHDLPKEATPLTPLGYWRESLVTWGLFSKRTTEIMLSQWGNPGASKAKTDEPGAEPLASELLRTLSDMNLRHWQNTARLLESFPGWVNIPQNLAGSALVDWFDNLKRGEASFSPSTAPAKRAEADDPRQPRALQAPTGKADDLTRIKGIGPKLSSLLNELGIYHFKQIASWSQPEARWVEDYLAFKGRVGREDWIAQARALAANGSATVH